MRMSASYALLGILSRQSSYGYDLKREYDYLYGKQKKLPFGQVYSSLSRLLRDNKLTIETTEQSVGPERKLYAITQLGRDELEKWLATPEKLHPDMQSVLFVKVVTSILLDKEPNTYLDAQRISHLERMRELTRLRRSSDLAQSMQADFAIFHLEADLKWIDLTAARLQELKEEIRHAR
jgi:DNA-binding PadR family transcriptional regulator